MMSFSQHLQNRSLYEVTSPSKHLNQQYTNDFDRNYKSITESTVMNKTLEQPISSKLNDLLQQKFGEFKFKTTTNNNGSQIKNEDAKSDLIQQLNLDIQAKSLVIKQQNELVQQLTQQLLFKQQLEQTIVTKDSQIHDLNTNIQQLNQQLIQAQEANQPLRDQIETINQENIKLQLNLHKEENMQVENLISVTNLNLSQFLKSIEDDPLYLKLEKFKQIVHEYEQQIQQQKNEIENLNMHHFTQHQMLNDQIVQISQQKDLIYQQLINEQQNYSKLETEFNQYKLKQQFVNIEDLYQNSLNVNMEQLSKELQNQVLGGQNYVQQNIVNTQQIYEDLNQKEQKISFQTELLQNYSKQLESNKLQIKQLSVENEILAQQVQDLRVGQEQFQQFQQQLVSLNASVTHSIQQAQEQQLQQSIVQENQHTVQLNQMVESQKDKTIQVLREQLQNTQKQLHQVEKTFSTNNYNNLQKFKYISDDQLQNQVSRNQDVVKSVQALNLALSITNQTKRD